MKSSLTLFILQLVEGQLVVMQADDKDRRFKRLSLTSEGKKLEARLTGAQMKLLSAVFTATGDRTQAAWKTVMLDMAQRAGVKS